MKNMKLSILPLLLFIASCARVHERINLTNRVGDDEILIKGYRPGKIYRTQRDLLITGKDKLSLNKPGGSEPFVAQYRSDPSDFPGIVGVVQSGTRIRISKVEFYESRMGGIVNAYGVILSGESEGSEVLLRGVSNFIYGTSYGSLSIPDPDYLSD